MDLMAIDHRLTTTRSVRKRLHLNRPVEPEIIERCIEVAAQAPTGGNRQGWHFVVVTDPVSGRVSPSTIAAHMTSISAPPPPLSLRLGAKIRDLPSSGGFGRRRAIWQTTGTKCRCGSSHVSRGRWSTRA